MRPSNYIERIKLVPGLFAYAIRVLREGRPLWEDISLKYDDRFLTIFRSRDRRKGVSLTKDEVYVLYSGLLATRPLEGAIAEVGVHKGGSANVICQAKEDKELFLFDTFEGMPDNKISEQMDRWPRGTHKGTTLAEVEEYLADYPAVHFIKGIFPDSLQDFPQYDFEHRKFSFVHLDVDLYQSTLDCLSYFYPRMTAYGRIISHNYNLSSLPGGDTPGVKKAFLEFFKTREYLITEISDTQCMVIKPVVE